MRYQLDVRRMLCPMPVIRTQNKIKDLVDGDILDVFCTDPGVMSDIPAWARINGHAIIDCIERDKDILVTLRVKGSD